MTQSEQLKENADNCLQLAENAEAKPVANRYLRMAQAWKALAGEQEWLDGKVPPVTVRAA